MKNTLIPVMILLITALLLMGCSNDENQNKSTDKTDPSENASATQTEKKDDVEESSKPVKKKDKTESISNSEPNTDNSNETSPDDVEKNISEKETNKGTSEEETNVEQKNKDNSGTQSDNQDTEIKTDTPEKDQKKAISLVRDYLRDKYDDFVEDKDNFLSYDGEVRGHIIVRYATLVSGHTSTNGRYAVDIDSGKIKDVTADPLSVD